jgi:hypothetical protein
VHLAFKEQEEMELDWYRKFKPILALDPTFTNDHVTAFNTAKCHKSVNNDSKPAEKENFLIHNGFKKRVPPQSINPNQSRNFTPFVILKKLKQKFKISWQSSMNASRKLEFYRTLKASFTKESYLDHVKTFTDRANLTRLRISAHRLEIEIGRRNNTPRTERLCHWCKTSLGAETVENESHFISDCDLNGIFRRKVHQKIFNVIDGSSPQNQYTMHILTLTNPNCEATCELTKESQCHLSRIIARFVTQCLNQRKKFKDSITNARTQDSSISA